jgi:hypothetical protein
VPPLVPNAFISGNERHHPLEIKTGSFPFPN